MNILRLIKQSFSQVSTAAGLISQVIINKLGKKMTITNLIEAYNRAYVSYYPAGSAQVQGQTFKIDSAMASLISNAVVLACHNYQLEIPFLLAVMCQESLFSNKAVCNNLGHNRPTPSFQTSDWGLCQLSGAYLPSRAGMEDLTQAQMIARAQDPAFAVPIMAGIYADDMKSAQKFLTTNIAGASAIKEMNKTSMSDIEWVACAYYNRGESGGNKDILAKDISLLQHPVHCGNWYKIFKTALNASNEKSIPSKETPPLESIFAQYE